jgi:hypothetical protein
VATAIRQPGRILPGRLFPDFSPYQPPLPPSGSYDPSLDAQRAAAQRGLGDLRQDTALGNTRAAVDYGLGVEDYGRQYGRGAADLNLALGRGESDYSRNVGLLQRSYTQLARRQAEAGRAHGVLSGGLAARAAAIRAQNEAIDQQPLDTGISRLRQDTQTQLGRLGEDRDLGIARLGLGYDRGVTDRGTALTRAERENTQFGLDVGTQEAYQAGQAGWAPPGRGEAGGMPKNEFVAPDGSHYKVIVSNGWRYKVDQAGRVISKERRR